MWGNENNEEEKKELIQGLKLKSDLVKKNKYVTLDVKAQPLGKIIVRIRAPSTHVQALLRWEHQTKKKDQLKIQFILQST